MFYSQTIILSRAKAYCLQFFVVPGIFKNIYSIGRKRNSMKLDFQPVAITVLFQKLRSTGSQPIRSMEVGQFLMNGERKKDKIRF